MDTPQLMIQTAKGIERLSLNQNASWTFGRSKMNTIRLNDPNVSRHHAKLEIVQERHCYWVDLNSQNGSLVNGQRVTQPILLKHGDRISVGKTLIIFQHSVVTSAGVPAPPPRKQVLMLQGSAIQGKIWQEILLSQNASVIWELSIAQLKNRINLNATSNTLPKLLLIDRNACLGNFYEFSDWCCQTYPQLTVFAIDSIKQIIPENERHTAIQHGCKNLFPALPKNNLVNHVVKIADQVNEVLQAMGSQFIQPNQLLPTLQNLENLMLQASSFIPLMCGITDSENDIPTSLDLRKSR